MYVCFKVLIKEVGEGATIGSLTTNGDGWRGRAQQILSLQNKVNTHCYKTPFII